MTNSELSVLAGPASGRDFRPNSPELETLNSALRELENSNFDLPNIIGGKEVFTQNTQDLVAPHNHDAKLGRFHQANESIMHDAIESALTTSKSWADLNWHERAKPFLKAAEMLESGPWRDKLVGATMLELSKTNTQAEGDAACETIDVIRMNFNNLIEVMKYQPTSSVEVENELEYRPLEGFVFAVSPFNFTSMSHLAFGPASLGNTVVWKPAESATLVSYLSLELLREAGLPDGVINLVLGSGSALGPSALTNRDLAAVSFTGSTNTFQSIYRSVGENVANYRNYPRLVGETGGKAFVLVHSSANVDAVVTACVKGAFEYQGQKCSAASRVYAPQSLWPQIKTGLIDLTKQLVMGDPTQPETFLGAVINEKQFNLHSQVLAKAATEAEVLVGGQVHSQNGWFIEPTVIQTQDPRSVFMTEEFFGPILSVYVYPDSQWQEIVELTDQSTVYGLAGSLFAQDDSVITDALIALRYTAGNISINDKPTGATIGQQPFGGSRASGTNDKVGTTWNLMRYLSPRTIKRNLNPPVGM